MFSSGFRQDLRYALRFWRRHPLSAALCAATLAVGIGAASAIFSILNAVLVQPLPYREPERLVMVWNVNERAGLDIEQMKKGTASLSPPEHADWRTRSGIFEEMMGFQSTPMRVSRTEDPGMILVYRLTAGAFPMMGARRRRHRHQPRRRGRPHALPAEPALRGRVARCGELRSGRHAPAGIGRSGELRAGAARGGRGSARRAADE